RLALALLIVVGPIAGLLLTSQLESLQEQRRSQDENFQAIGDTPRANVDSFGGDLESMAFAASVGVSGEQAPTQDSAGAYLANLRSTYGNLRALFVTNTNGLVLASDDGSLNGRQLRDRPYVQALQNGAETVW